MRRLLATQSSATAILIRIVVGSIFLTEGIQKFPYPADFGAGRFAKIGIPAPGDDGSDEPAKSLILLSWFPDSKILAMWRSLVSSATSAVARASWELADLLLKLMLKITFPAIRKPFDSDSLAQPSQIVFLKSIKPSDIGHTSLLLLSVD